MDRPVSALLQGRDREILAVRPQATVAEAVRIMNEQNIGAVLVTDDDRRLLGIFTERDVLRRVVDGSLDPQETPISEVMTTSVACVRPSTKVHEALVVFNTHNCRHLPVVDNDRVTGLLSIRDVTAALVQDQDHQITELTDYIYGSYGRHAGVG